MANVIQTLMKPIEEESGCVFRQLRGICPAIAESGELCGACQPSACLQICLLPFVHSHCPLPKT